MFTLSLVLETGITLLLQTAFLAERKKECYVEFHVVLVMFLRAFWQFFYPFGGSGGKEKAREKGREGRGEEGRRERREAKRGWGPKGSRKEKVEGFRGYKEPERRREHWRVPKKQFSSAPSLSLKLASV
jgi:hypothetical protein